MLAARCFLRFGSPGATSKNSSRSAGSTPITSAVSVGATLRTLLIDAASPCRHAVGGRWFVDETCVEVAGCGATSTWLPTNTTCSSPRCGRRSRGPRSVWSQQDCATANPGTGRHAHHHDAAPRRMRRRRLDHGGHAPPAAPPRGHPAVARPRRPQRRRTVPHAARRLRCRPPTGRTARVRLGPRTGAHRPGEPVQRGGGGAHASPRGRRRGDGQLSSLGRPLRQPVCSRGHLCRISAWGS